MIDMRGVVLATPPVPPHAASTRAFENSIGWADAGAPPHTLPTLDGRLNPIASHGNLA